MKKFVFASMVLFAVSAQAANQSAESLSKRLYQVANENIALGRWRAADDFLQKSYFLNPDFKTVEQKRNQLSRYLQHQFEKERRLGKLAHQSLQPETARFHWDRAYDFLIDRNGEMALAVAADLKELNGSVQNLPQATPAEDALQKKRVAMEEVKHFLEAGDKTQAEMTLSELIYQSPEDGRSQELLQKVKEEKTAGPSEDIEVRFASGEKLFQEGNQTRELLIRYRLFKEGVNLFQEDDLKPPYYKELLAAFEKLEKQLRDVWDLKIDGWKKRVARGEQLHAIAEQLRENIPHYPVSPSGQELLQIVYDNIAEKTEPLLMMAKTAHELSGCRSAIPQYRAVQTNARFREVATWQEAEKNLLGCTEKNQIESD